MKKTFPIVMLPTEKASSIHLNPKKLVKWHMDITPTNKDCVNQHLYIISDDEIKEGDWYIDDTLQLRKAIMSDKDWQNSGKPAYTICKKIVATTDKSLGKEGYTGIREDMAFFPLPQLRESFIQSYIKAYNEGKPITEVDLEMEEIIYPFAQIRPEVKPIRYYQIKTRPDNTVIYHQSKMYSRDEVEKLLSLFADTFINRDEEVDKWIQDNLS